MTLAEIAARRLREEESAQQRHAARVMGGVITAVIVTAWLLSVAVVPR